MVFSLYNFRVYILSDVLRLYYWAFLKCDLCKFIQTKLHPYVAPKSFYSA